MKNKLKTILYFFSKNYILKKYLQAHETKINIDGDILIKHAIKIKDINDQFLLIKIKLKKDKDKQYINELINNINSWNELNEDELINKIDEYYQIIYKYKNL